MEDKLPNSNITYRDFLNHLGDKVIELQREYIEKYHRKPKYIKMPRWCLYELKNVTKEMLTNFDKKTEPHFIGMRICETDSITTIGEIEVF